jgi:hypothetical protein
MNLNLSKKKRKCLDVAIGEQLVMSKRVRSDDILTSIKLLPTDLRRYLSTFIFVRQQYGSEGFLFEDGCSQCGLGVVFIDNMFNPDDKLQTRAFSYQLGPGAYYAGQPRVVTGHEVKDDRYSKIISPIDQTSMTFIPPDQKSTSVKNLSYPLHVQSPWFLVCSQIKTLRGALNDRSRDIDCRQMSEFGVNAVRVNYRHCDMNCHRACRQSKDVNVQLALGCFWDMHVPCRRSGVTPSYFTLFPTVWDSDFKNWYF